MRLESPPVPSCVLDDHDKPHRALMHVGHEVALAGIPPVRVLEVRHEPVDLHREDLGGTRENDVNRFSVLAGSHLQLGPPRWVCDRAEDPCNRKLPRVAKGANRCGIPPQHHVEADRRADGTKDVELNRGIASLDSANGIGGDTCAAADGPETRMHRRSRYGHVRPKRLGLASGTPISHAPAQDSHRPILGPWDYSAHTGELPGVVRIPYSDLYFGQRLSATKAPSRGGVHLPRLTYGDLIG